MLKTRTKRSPEWLAKRRAVRGYKTKEQRAADNLARYHRKRDAEMAKIVPAGVEPRGGMRLDKRTGCWRVGVPVQETGRVEWLSTEETDYVKALKAVDASGVQRLSILARAKCLTADAASIIMAGHVVNAEDVIKQWTADMRVDQSRGTARSYGFHIRQMFRLYNLTGQPVSRLTRDQIYDFVNHDGTTGSTRKLRLAAVRSFYRHCAGYGHVVGNISDTIRINHSGMTVAQREMAPAVPFTEEEYRRIMAAPTTPLFWRWATALGYWLGLRMVDACRLEWATMGDGVAILYPQKTGRRLVLPLGDPLLGSGELREVFAQIREKIPQDGPYCFAERKARYPGAFRTCYRAEYKGVLQAAGIEGKTFHGWRHSFKLRLQAAGKTIEQIAALMGHADTKVTEGYGRATAQPSSPQPPGGASTPSGEPGPTPASAEPSTGSSPMA